MSGKVAETAQKCQKALGWHLDDLEVFRHFFVLFETGKLRKRSKMPLIDISMIWIISKIVLASDGSMNNWHNLRLNYSSCFAPFFNYYAFIFQFSWCRAARLTFNQISSKQMRQIVTKKAKQNNSLHRRYLICQCNKRVKNRKHLDIKDKFG